MNTNYKALAQEHDHTGTTHSAIPRSQELRGMKHPCSLQGTTEGEGPEPPGENSTGFPQIKTVTAGVALREKEDNELTSLNDTRAKLVTCWTKAEVTAVTTNNLLQCGIVCDTRQDRADLQSHSLK